MDAIWIMRTVQQDPIDQLHIAQASEPPQVLHNPRWHHSGVRWTRQVQHYLADANLRAQGGIENREGLVMVNSSE